MSKLYIAPRIVDYGTISSITGETGTSSSGDWWLMPNGENVQRGLNGSIDGCAQETVSGVRKCICQDSGTC